MTSTNLFEIPATPIAEAVATVIDSKNEPAVNLCDVVLEPQQQKAYEQVTDFLLDDKQQEFILQGYAGTGKSTLVKYILANFPQIQKLKAMVCNDEPMETLLTATTHKAAGVLGAMTGQYTMTIHSAMNLRLDYGNNGYKKELKQYGIPNIENTLVVIDEGGLLDEKLITTVRAAMTPTTKVLYIGDPAQLPPTSLTYSPLFHQGLPTATLTDIIRQEKGNTIIELCTMLREATRAGDFKAMKPTGAIEYIADYQVFEQRLLNDFKTPGESRKVVCWTNRAVQHYNRLLKTHTSDTGHSDMAEGDFVTNNRTVVLKSGTIKTDTTVQILSMTPETRHGVEGHRVILANSNHESFLPKLHTDREKLERKLIKADDLASMKIYREVDRWFDLRYEFACTAHKSQGSTYDAVYIDLSNFKGCKPRSLLARLLYVAVSRASKKVVITGDF